MSDLEDLDHEPEDMSLEEELSAPAAEHPASAASSEGFSGRLKTLDKGVLVKAAAALVVVIGGGAYFMVSHHAQPKQIETSVSQPLAQNAAPGHETPTAPLVPQKDDKQAGADSQAWNVPPSAPAQQPAATPSGTAAKPHDLLPAAIPPMEQGATNTVGTPASPPIVNEMPPPAAQLNDTGNAAPSQQATASIPGMPTTAPSMPPSALPSAFGAPQATGPDAVPATPPAAAKNEEPMPSALVPAVDKADINKTGSNDASGTANAAPKNPEPDNAVSASPADATPAQTAKVEELQKKIDDLEKTISQLQQAAVVKEDTAAKSGMAVQKGHHARSSHHQPARHVVAVKWVLKAAKPGVAWVAKKGSDDLRMVETGDSLTGLGDVTAIIRDSSGAWMVEGTKGRISQ